MKRRVFLFLTVLLISAGLAWLSGYNFDHRSEEVAFSTFISLMFAVFVAFFPYGDL